MNLVDSRIDAYLADLAAHSDPVLDEMERLGSDRGFPIVGPQVGRLLEVLARTVAATRVLELGSGFGYSAFWFLRGLPPSGQVVMTEGSRERSDEARAFLRRGGFAGRFVGHVGDALEFAETLVPPFDIVFCDIDKHDYPKALPIARRLLRPGEPGRGRCGVCQCAPRPAGGRAMHRPATYLCHRNVQRRFSQPSPGLRAHLADCRNCPGRWRRGNAQL